MNRTDLQNLLGISRSSLHRACQKLGIPFSNDKVFNQEEIDRLKAYRGDVDKSKSEANQNLHKEVDDLLLSKQNHLQSLEVTINETIEKLNGLLSQIEHESSRLSLVKEIKDLVEVRDTVIEEIKHNQGEFEKLVSATELVRDTNKQVMKENRILLEWKVGKLKAGNSMLAWEPNTIVINNAPIQEKRALPLRSKVYV